MSFLLNVSKCEFISSSAFQVSDVTFKSFSRTLHCWRFTARGSFVPWCGSRRSYRAAGCSEHRRIVERLNGIGSEDARILLRSSSAPRVQHLLRCSPSMGHPSLIGLMNLSGRRSASFTILFFPMINGFMPLCQ